MPKSLFLTLVLVALGLGVGAYVVGAQFITPHNATGSINTAVAQSELLYICQPSGTTTNPICPVDTADADETIYAANEDLVPGSVRWQKIRLRNVGTEPWDLLSVQKNWSEVSDPSGLCEVIPEPVVLDGITQEERSPVQGARGFASNSNTANTLNDSSKNFNTLGVQSGDAVYLFGGSGQGQTRTIIGISQTELNVTPVWTTIPTPSDGYVVLRPIVNNPGPGGTILGIPGAGYGANEPVENVAYNPVNDNHGPVSGVSQFRRLALPGYYGGEFYTVHVAPGGYEDLLLGIRLPINTPSDCLNVVWELTTTWNVQIHNP